MTRTRKWALGLFLALLSTSYSNSQEVVYQTTAGTTSTALDPGTVYSTGNIVQPTIAGTGTTPWVNGVYQDQLTCWAWGNPGNCGPNPSVRPGGYINYSFGYTDLYQAQSIASLLPQTGLRVNGYTFGFTAKNGNGWDDGRVDQLGAYVSFYGTDNKVKDYTYYDLNSKFNWTTFSYSKDFVSPYAASELSTVQYGFVGKDNNFWAGNYGPEIMDVNFSLKYSVDPCATNPLYSPTCKGYMDALAKLAPAPVTVVAEAPPPPPPPDESVLAPPPPPGSPPPPNGPQQSGPPPPPGGPMPGSGPAPTPASAPTATAKSSDNSSKAGPSLGTVLSMISTNQARIGNEAKAVVQAAESAAAKDAQQAQTQAESVAALLTEQSIAGSTTTATSTSSSGLPMASSSSQSQMSSVALLTATQTTVGKVEILKQPTQPDLTESSSAMSTPMVVNYSLQINNSAPTTTVLNNSYNSELSRFEPLLLRGPTAVTEVEMPQLEGIKIGTRSVLMDAIEQQQPVQQTTAQTQQTSTVNRNVQSNELAAGVDISNIATQPVGYQAYSFALTDAPFYAPREIYRNQVNVDNVRLLRGLGSDRLHQQLIDMQYK